MGGRRRKLECGSGHGYSKKWVPVSASYLIGAPQVMPSPTAPPAQEQGRSMSSTSGPTLMENRRFASRWCAIFFSLAAVYGLVTKARAQEYRSDPVNAAVKNDGAMAQQCVKNPGRYGT